MPELIKENGLIVPQYLRGDGTAYERLKGKDGGVDHNVISSPTVEARLDTLITHTDGVESKLDTLISHADGVEGKLDTLHTDALNADARMSTVIGHVGGVESKLDTIAGLVDTVEAKLDVLHADAQCTDSKVAAVVEHVNGLEGALGTPADAEATAGNGSVIGLIKALRAKLGGVILAAGNAIVGRVGIDQTTDGTTNRVVSKISQAAGENVVKDADIGTGITGAVMPAGGGGLLGWLSAIWTRLAGVVVAAGDAVIGRVKVTDGVNVAGVDAATGALKTIPQGTTPVQLTGSYASIKNGITGLKTITTTAAELFAGASARLAGRVKMVVHNPLTSAEPILFGYLSTACNRSILPGNAHTFNFNAATAVPIYFKTASASVANVETEEVA